MDFQFTPEEEALRKEFDDFFREEMKNAPPEWGASLEAIYGSDAGWEFHKQMARKLGAKGWLSSTAETMSRRGNTCPLWHEVSGSGARPGVSRTLALIWHLSPPVQ